MSFDTSKPVTKTKVAVLFSGGWDSLYCFSKALLAGEDPDLLFTDYGQPYLAQELAAVNAMKAGLPRQDALVMLTMGQLDSNAGIFDMRNEKLLVKAAELGYEKVYFGTRNLIPTFDKYGDSNWWWASRLARKLNILITMPATMMPKFVIIGHCTKYVPQLAKHVFTTEGLS